MAGSSKTWVDYRLVSRDERKFVKDLKSSLMKSDSPTIKPYATFKLGKLKNIK